MRPCGFSDYKTPDTGKPGLGQGMISKQKKDAGQDEEFTAGQDIVRVGVWVLYDLWGLLQFDCQRNNMEFPGYLPGSAELPFAAF